MPSPSRSRSRSRSPARPAAPKVKKTKKAASRPKAASGRPSTLAIVIQAIGAMKDRKGSSAQAIRKYIVAHYPGIPANFLGSMLKRAFAAGLKSGALVRPKGSTVTGATGRFRVGKVTKPKKAAPKKKVAKKTASKAKKARKPSAGKVKKVKKAKSIKKKSATKKRTKPAKKVAKKTKPTKKSAKAKPTKATMVPLEVLYTRVTAAKPSDKLLDILERIINMTEQVSSLTDCNSLCEEDFIGLNTLVEQGDPNKVREYISNRNITPNGYNDYFESHHVYGRYCAVGLAAKCGHLEVMKTLISLGFSVTNENTKNFGGFQDVNPINLACEAGHVAVVKSLVEDYGVDIYHRGSCYTYSEPALCRAASNGRIGVVQYFLENGTDVNSKYGLDRSSLLHSSAENDDPEMCRHLLAQGAEVDMFNRYNLTPLILAARAGCDATTSVLLDAGADVNYEDDYWQSPFLNAAENGHLSTMKLLASRGADPETDDRFHKSPLHHAVTDKRYDVADYLIVELNVSLEPDEDCYETPFRQALREHCYDIVDLFVRGGYNPVEEVAEFYDSDDDEKDIKPTRKRVALLGSRDVISENQKKIRELKRIISNARPLQTLCVFSIRRLLGRRLSADLDRLPLCGPLKNIILKCDVAVVF